MNFRTTLVLLAVAAAGVGVWLVGFKLPERLAPVALAPKQGDEEDKGSIYGADVDAGTIQKIAISRGDEKIELEKKEVVEKKNGVEKKKESWALAGGFLTRDQEIDELVTRLAYLRSRFNPIELPEDEKKRKEELAAFGLGKPAITAEVAFGQGDDAKRFKLAFGEGHDPDSSFYRPTYVRVNEGSEVLRLGPGLLAVLDRPREFYLRRALFKTDRVARSPRATEKVHQLIGTFVETSSAMPGGGAFRIQKGDGDAWELSAPYRDRVDPDRLGSLLQAFHGLWVEKFVTKLPIDVPVQHATALIGFAGSAGCPLGGAVWATHNVPQPDTRMPTAGADGNRAWVEFLMGLYPAPQVVQVKDADGERSLEIGRPAPSPSGAFGEKTPNPLDPAGGRDQFRYARLKGNDQVFLIGADSLRDVFLTPEKIRDDRLARFEDSEVRRIEIDQGPQQKLVLFRDKDDDSWKVEMPGEGAVGATTVLAAEERVRDILSAINVANAAYKEEDQRLFAVAGIGIGGAPFGQSAPLTAAALGGSKVWLVDDRNALTPTEATVKLTIAEKDKEKGAEKTREVVLKVGRRDSMSDKVAVRVGDWPRLMIVDAKILANALRPAVAYRGKLLDVAVADIQQLIVEQKGSKVVLMHDQDKWKMSQPATAEADAGKAGALADVLAGLAPTEYDPGRPTDEELDKKYGLGPTALAVTVQVKNKLHVLRVGKQREGKKDYYARLDAGSFVFAISPEAQATLSRDALQYLPLQLWKPSADGVASIRIERAGATPYVLTRQMDRRWRISEPYQTNALDTALTSVLPIAEGPFAERYETIAAEKPEMYGLDKPHLKLTITPAGKDAKPHELIVGGTLKDSKDRFARLGDGKAVFILKSDVVAALDRPALDLVDTLLLKIALDDVTQIQSRAGAVGMTLQPKDKVWQVVEGPGAAFTADEQAVASLRGTLLNLRAESYAEFDPKADLTKYGLGKPFATLTIAVKPKDGQGAPRHILELGDEVKGKAGQRYARLDGGAGVAVLTQADTRILAANHLEYVNHKLLGFPAEQATGLTRQKGPETFEIVKADGEWQIAKPEAQPGDEKSIAELFRQLGGLRAVSIVEYPLLDPKKYGLDTPSAVLTVRVTGADGKPAQHIVALGAEVPGKKGERYVRVDNGLAVALLPAIVTQKLDAAPITFRNRLLAKIDDADKLILQRNLRQATFARPAGTWKMTAPAEDAKLDNEGLDDLLGKAAKLEADELVADKATTPEALKPYGLDRPTARWQFFYGDKMVLDLVVGALDASGKRAYARIGASGIVFLMSPELTRRALGEFRDRTVWSMPPDVTQADSLTITRGGKTLALRKEGFDWKVAGKPETKLANDTVGDTLAAFAGLKLEHYALDKGADLKLFGLDPPDSIIEVGVGERKVLLHLGRFEADSKRAYAHVPDKDRTDVFVLSAEDTTRLLRDVEAFTKPLPPKASTPPTLPPNFPMGPGRN